MAIESQLRVIGSGEGTHNFSISRGILSNASYHDVSNKDPYLMLSGCRFHNSREMVSN